MVVVEKVVIVGDIGGNRGVEGGSVDGGGNRGGGVEWDGGVGEVSASSSGGGVGGFSGG